MNFENEIFPEEVYVEADKLIARAKAMSIVNKSHIAKFCVTALMEHLGRDVEEFAEGTLEQRAAAVVKVVNDNRDFYDHMVVICESCFFMGEDAEKKRNGFT